MTIDKSYLKHYFFSFKGRSTRAEWWLNHFIVGFGILFSMYIDVEILNYAFIEYKGALVGGFVFLLFGIPLFCSNVSVVVRRWHDLNRSWLWILVHFIPIVGNLYGIYCCGFKRGTVGPNRYGDDPLEPSTSSSKDNFEETTRDIEETSEIKSSDKEEIASSEEVISDNEKDSPEDK